MKKASCVMLVAVVGLLSYVPVHAGENATVLVLEQSRIIQLSQSAEIIKIILDQPGPARLLGGFLYVRQGANIIVYDTTGKKQKSISIPAEVQWSVDFVVIPDKRIAFLDNMHDVIYFVDENGKYLKTVAIADKSDNHLQNMDGVVVEGKLIVSENGHNELVVVDLATYESSVFRSLKHLRGWLGAIAYAEGQYYICQNQDIYSFKPESPDVTKVATTPEWNITGIVFTQGRLFAVVNGMSKIKERSLAAKCRTNNGVLYKIDPKSGEVTLLKDGLNYPQGILLLNATGK